jgi:hypothetical protein
MIIQSAATVLMLAQVDPAAEATLTTAGWTIMIVSLAAVTLLNVFCFYRVLTLPPAAVEDHMKAPLEIDTGDIRDAD